MSAEKSPGEQYLQAKINQLKTPKELERGESNELASVEQALEILTALSHNAFAKRETAWQKLNSAKEHLKGIRLELLSDISAKESNNTGN